MKLTNTGTTKNENHNIRFTEHVVEVNGDTYPILLSTDVERLSFTTRGKTVAGRRMRITEALYRGKPFVLARDQREAQNIQATGDWLFASWDDVLFVCPWLK